MSNGDPPGVQQSTTTRGGDLNSAMPANSWESRISQGSKITATSSRGGEGNSGTSAAVFEARCVQEVVTGGH